MRIVGFMALHYGLDYIQYAIESIIDYVDILHIAYSPVGSHGVTTPVPCPESERELRLLAYKAAGRKLVWHRDTWPHEGAQRDMIYEYEPTADIIVVCDSDEVWHGGLLERALLTLQPFDDARRFWRVPMVHYWRSFRRCMIADYSYPIRIISPGRGALDMMNMHSIPNEFGYINHFGYAIKPDLMRYKWLIHGHRGEYRQGWFDDIYMNRNRETDLHPAGNDSWNYAIVDPLDYMPDWMIEHPFYDMEWIE